MSTSSTAISAASVFALRAGIWTCNNIQSTDKARSATSLLSDKQTLVNRLYSRTTQVSQHMAWILIK